MIKVVKFKDIPEIQYRPNEYHNELIPMISALDQLNEYCNTNSHLIDIIEVQRHDDGNTWVLVYNEKGLTQEEFSELTEQDPNKQGE